MGRGRVVYRGNPPVSDLEKTAKAILRSLGQSVNQHLSWVSSFARAFSDNILTAEDFTWYHGMRDFYGTVSTIRILASPLEQSKVHHKLRKFKPEFNSHVAKWAVNINLRGFPEFEKETELAESMIRSFGLNENTPAKWKWKTEDSDEIYLCDCCVRMQLYRLSQIWKVDHPQDQLSEDIVNQLFKQYSTPVQHNVYCQYFDKNHFIPAAEVISYSLREHSSRHVMIFTKANAALFLLFSMKIVRKDQCTVLFQSTSKDQNTTTSELVQQMMRIKACMREGKTLILVKSRHLYESLLDALNVHYTKDHSYDGNDNLHKTVLSMAGVTQSVFVDPSFRCIVLEDQDELRSSVLPPMINRFSKVVLTYGSALNANQRVTRDELTAKCSIKLDDKSLNILEFLIAGLSEESLDSAVCAFTNLDDVVVRLCYLFSRKNLRRLGLGLIEGLNTDELKLTFNNWQHHWEQYECNESLAEVASDALVREPESSHLMIITEQLQLDVSSVIETIKQIFDGCGEDDEDDDEDSEEEEEEEEDDDDDEVYIFPSFHKLIDEQ